MKKKVAIPPLKGNFHQNINEEVDLEDALDEAGMGRYQYVHCLLMLTTLATALLEMIGNAFILPAAACDLQVPDQLKGIITSIPNIGIILTAPLWGRAADSLGRKPVLLWSTAAAGSIGLAAAFMPNLAGYAVCKFGSSLFLSCPSSLGFAYAGELIPLRRRDRTLLIINGLLFIATTMSPVLAWVVLTSTPSFHLGAVTILPWRILTMVYSMPLILSSWWMTTALESPKFLMIKDKSKEALEVLRHIYSVNTKKAPEDYPVKSIRKLSEEAPLTPTTSLLPKRRRESLLRPPHIKWLFLTGTLMFGLFAVLNGLFLFSPDVINRASSDTSEVSGTICTLVGRAHQSSSSCEAPMSRSTFTTMVSTDAVYGLLVLGIAVSTLDKRTQVVGMFATVAVTCTVAGSATNRLLQGLSMSSLQLTSLGVGPLAAYAVHLFPTTLRGTAVGTVMMCGRLGSVVGANVAGYLLTVACAYSFYGSAALLALCALLGLLLPKDQSADVTDIHNEIL